MSGVQWERQIYSLRRDIIAGRVENLFTDEYFVLDLLKMLYDDSVSLAIKTELLVILEQYGSFGAIHMGSVDHVILSLLDVFNQVKNQDVLSMHILSTLTSLLIQFDQQNSDIYTSVKQTLINLITAKNNVIESRRLISCACHCLITLEDWLPGILWRDKDVILKMMKLERTDVYQDYVLLITKIMENAYTINTGQEDTKNGSKHIDIKIDRQMSVDPVEHRQTVSMIMDNTALFTPSGLWQIILSLSHLVQHNHEISPTIFKPLILHHMATFNSPLLHLVLYLQREFEKEVLTESEEKQLLGRMVTGINHPCITPAQRLFYCHWMRHFSQNFGYGEPMLPKFIMENHSLNFYPSVFDPLDCQLAKLCMFNLCFEPLTTKPSDTAAALLLSSLGHLHKLVWHTGGDRPAVALFRALFHMYHRHCSKTFSQDINRFLRGLISGFPYFIPNALDFIEGLRETTPDSPVYLEILKLLHTQVVSTPEEQAAIYYHFYLQVLKRASLQKEIPPQKTVKFLSYLAENSIMVDEGSWRLGNGILAVCQNLLICHGTDNLYLEIGDLLFYLMTRYIDTDIQDRAMFYYTLLTSATDAKIAALLKTVSGTQSFNQALSTLLPENKDNDRCSQVHVLDKPVLDWERIKMDIVRQNEESNIYDQNKDGNSDLTSYLDDLNTAKFVINATYSLKLKDLSYQDVYAITVHIDTGDSYEDIKDINITSLSCNEIEEIKINIYPTKPIPSKFSSWVEFVKDKRTYRCSLPDIVLTLTDIMTPLQSDSKGDLYKEMWEELTKGSRQDGTKCIKSVKLIHKDQTEFEEVIKGNLNCYRVDKSDTSAVKFGMFLPPSYHLLLHCHGNSDHMVVFMVTDFPSILPYIDQLLSSL